MALRGDGNGLVIISARGRTREVSQLLESRK